MKEVWLLAAILAVAACSKPAKAPLVSEAESAVAKKQKDPTSLLFTDERMVGENVVCGFVNGKNSYGAYAGPSRFTFIKHTFGGNIDIGGAYIEGTDIGRPGRADHPGEEWVPLDFSTDIWRKYGC